MDTPHRLLPRLASSVASGDVEAAAAMFGADGRITIHDGQHEAGTVPARVGLAAAIAAFSEIAYTPVLHLDGDGFSDDGDLTGWHRCAFLGCPPTGRRVYLNVHLPGQVAEDGLLAELTVGTSLASLRHQLRGGETLAWSRWRFVRFAADEKAATTLGMLAECFAALGGVSRVVLADRMGCLKGGVVANRVVPTPDYVRFASGYRFRPDFCEALLMTGPGGEGDRGEPGRLRQGRSAAAAAARAR